MKTNCLLLFCILLSCSCFSQVISSFTAPDTVCVNTPVNITNTSVGASSYYWNFCVADVNAAPTAANLGNPGNYLSQPVFVDIEEDNGNYYGFVVNHVPGGITRLDFGNSLLNNPTPVFLGNISGVMNTGYGSEGIQIVKANGNWYGLLVGGSPSSGSTPKLITIYFGTNLNNPNPAAISWGNIGNMLQPIKLHVFQESGNWYGLTMNAESNTITRFNFTNDFNNTPIGVNLGNIGTLNYPTGVFALKSNNNWYVYVGNGGSNSITRLDFGNSLLNTPTGVNLGNPNGVLNQPRDITILKYCGQMVGFVVNGLDNTIAKLNFSSETSMPTGTALGNLGNLNFPHSLSKLFRVGNDIYSLITNVSNNTITRLKFTGCTSSSIPNSSAQNPPPVIYNSPGIYNINLSVDETLPTQSVFCKQVVVVPPPSYSPLKNISICGGTSVKIGSATHPANYLWNTGAVTDSIVVTAPGMYWVETTSYGCSSRDSFVVNFTSGPPMDFSYLQTMCSSKQVQFFTRIANLQSYQWSFGDGQVNTNSESPVINYTNYGIYPVQLKVRYADGCMDSLTKSINVNDVYNASVLTNSDTTICLGDSVLLKTNNSISDYCWKSSTGNIPGSLNTYVKPSVTTSYVLSSELTGINLVANSNFSLGNTGFNSDYIYSTSSNAEGQYWIGATPSAWQPNFANCSDHTSGSGNMMVINGATVANKKIWSQIISVTPNTDYQFSLWTSSLESASPAVLHFLINNADLGNSMQLSTTSCQWKRYSVRWNSGNNTIANIAILDSNLIASGNSFAIDDVFFGEVTTQTDSLIVNVTGLCDSIKINGPKKICSITDTVSYTIFKPQNCTQQYSLQVDNSFATIVSQTQTSVKLLFRQNGFTSIKVAYANNCKMVVDSIQLNIQFSPTSINFGPDVITCRDTSFLLNAGSGFISYLWQDASTDSTLFVNTPGTYLVTAQNLCGAQLKDTIQFTKSTVIPFSVQPLSVEVCKGDSVQFIAKGGNVYSWSPANTFNNSSSSNPKAVINRSQNFNVSISDTVCFRDTTIIIPVNALPPALITVSKSNDVNCGNDSATLMANGGMSYTWTPDLYIAKNLGNRITVKPLQSTTYFVQGKDATGCAGQDSVTVIFSKTGDQKLYMPTAFTPNGDGLNDVFKPTFIGPSAKYDFRIFNRWGQLVFRSTTPGEGWDGNFRGVPQKNDVYVFYITAEGGCNGKFEQKGTFALIR